MDREKARRMDSGGDLIDLSLGSSDLAAPGPAMEELRAATGDSSTHGYSLYASTRPFREAAAWYLADRLGVRLDPEHQVLPLVGTQEAVAHLSLAVLDPGDRVLIGEPHYPTHAAGVRLAGGEPVGVPLLPELDFTPDLERIRAEIRRGARMLVISYPNNPTTGVATSELFAELVELCHGHGVLLVHDFPYLDITFDGHDAPSVLQAPGGPDSAVELFTLSKSFNMGGFRLGFAAGSPVALRALARVKAVIDFNQYLGIQRAGAVALRRWRELVGSTVAAYRSRRDFTVDRLAAAGWSVPRPRATLYLWAQLPGGLTDDYAFCRSLVAGTGVALAPGSGFGQAGAAHVRFALVHPEPVLGEAVARIESFLRSD
jgi:aspartate/methionine/tyrosine aminotransferase